MKKKKKKKFPKNKRVMLLAPNPKTCTQYKEKTNQLTNKRKELDKPCHMYIRCQNTQKTKCIKKEKKTTKEKKVKK
jgi:hypothetical protein